MALRQYQEAAIEALYQAIREREDNPVIVAPTGSGKSHLIAAICKDAVAWKGRVVVVAHRRELLEQNLSKILAADPDLAIHAGVYSAGLGSRDTDHPIIVAGVQSVYRRAAELGHRDLILVDEAHRIPDDGEGQYRTFISGAKEINSAVRVVGLTATPYRMSTGSICGPDKILNHICHEIQVRPLIDAWFLCHLKGKAPVDPDLKDVHIKGGEFVADEAQAAMMQGVDAAVADMMRLASDRKSILVFAAGIEHGVRIAGLVANREPSVGFVCSESSDEEREDMSGRFRDGKLRVLCNVALYTEGFDAPGVDCVVLMRPTLSKGLYSQMVGRGFRIAPGKANCLVLDYAGNILRHGPVDVQEDFEQKLRRGRGKAPWKKCPECYEICHAACKECPACGFTFRMQEEPDLDRQASDAAVLSGQVKIDTMEVDEVEYEVWQKRDTGSKTMRVTYHHGLSGTSEWVCVEHQKGSYPWQKARVWWSRRSEAPIPETVMDAVLLARAGALAEPKTIQVRTVSGEKYSRIVGMELGEKPKTWGEVEETTVPF